MRIIWVRHDFSIVTRRFDRSPFSKINEL